MKNSVSVVIPTFNRSRLLPRAIQSALAAMSPGDEILVIDDGSTDDTPASVQQFDRTIRYVRIENSGPGAARNVGIRMARCPYVAFLDSDDQWVADKLELQRNVMAAFPSVVFSFGNMFATLSSGEVQHDLHSDWRTHPRIGSDSAPLLTEILGPGAPYSSFARLPQGRADFNVHVGDMYAAELEAHYVHSDAVMVRRELAGELFHYPEDIRLMEDYECFARLAKIGPAAYLDCELADLTTHSGDRLTDVEDVRHLTARIDLLQRVWGADQSFLKVHSARYRHILESKVRLRARLLISSGRLNEARDHLKATGGPLSYRLVASLPSALVNNVLRVRKKMRSP
jgi:glycosyltransferase involved in cell wall biosynthesis